MPMKKQSWQLIRETMRARYAVRPPMRAVEFWDGARLRLGQSRAVRTSSAGTVPMVFWTGYKRWALAAAAALIFSTGVVIVEWRGTAGTAGRISGISALERVDVWVDYQSVMVVNSARHRGTVVWVSGMSDRSEPN